MSDLLERAAARYASLGRFQAGFARGKLLGDPVYAALVPCLPRAGTLVDVGCGEGYLLAVAAAIQPDLDLLGVDHDPRRLAVGRRALPGVRFEAIDARTWEAPEADVFALIDVLHYQPPSQQDALLGRLAARLRPGGLLLVREGGDDAGWRSRWLACVERAMVALGRHRGDGVFFRPSSAIADELRALGLEVEVRPCREGTPFANFLTIARKPLAQP